nr:hypothetical protein [uncultured Rhodopila sp.]
MMLGPSHPKASYILDAILLIALATGTVTVFGHYLRSDIDSFEQRADDRLGQILKNQAEIMRRLGDK